MAKLTDSIKQRILSDWKVGISQNQLAKRYDVSPATINKLCKGVEQTNIELVNTKVALITALQEKNEYEVNSIEEEVNKKIRRQGLIFGNAEKLAGKLNIMADQIESPAEVKLLSEANMILGKSLGVIEQFAKSGDVNVQANTQVNNAPLEVKFVR